MKKGYLVRLLGVVIVAVGIIIWLLGGLEIPLTYRDLATAIPVHFALVVIGAVCILFPSNVMAVVVSFVPEQNRRAVETKLGVESSFGLSANPSPETLASALGAHMVRSNRRFGFVLVAVVLSFVVIVPLLVMELISRSNRELDAKLLVALVHENRLDHLAGDTVRGVLSLGARSLGADGSASSSESLRELYTLYSRLYLSGSRDKDLFEESLRQLYEERVRKYVMPGSVMLKPEAFGTGESTNNDARVALLTFLGFLCNEQGAQGRYLPPYLYARQFLDKAHEVARSGAAPGLHYARGWNYADTLKLYDEYVRAFADAAKSSSGAVTETQPLSKLRLAQSALDEFHHGQSASTSSFSSARFLNNLTDLRLSLIRQIHLDRTITAKDATDDADRKFLAEHGLNVSSGEHTEKLWTLIAEIRTDMDEAVKLVREPPVFFTRAQVYATEGELRDKLLHDSTDAMQLQMILDEALRDLQTARRLGVPKDYFTEDRAGTLFLEWLWRQDTLKQRLEQLAN